MSIFTQPFFSLAGQKERLTNVVSTLKSSITGQGVQANTSNPTVNKVLSAAASNPLTTAALITPVNTVSAAKAGFSALSTGGKIAVVGGASLAVPAIIANPKISGSIAQTPAKLANVGTNIGEVSKNPSWENVKKTFEENPIITGGLVAGTGLIVGKGVSNTIATLSNTAAVKENTKVATAAGSGLINSNLTSQTAGTSMSAPVSAVPAYNYLPTETMTKSYGNKNISTYKRKKTKTLYSSPVKVYNRIMVLNKNG